MCVCLHASVCALECVSMRVGMSVFVCMCLLPSCMSFVGLHLCVSALVLMSVDVAMWISMCVCVCRNKAHQTCSHLLEILCILQARVEPG